MTDPKQRNMGSGRVHQKNQTRNALLSAANALMAEGKQLSIQSVAAESGISQATVYRYFADVDALMMEAVLVLDLGLGGDDMEALEASFEQMSSTEERVLHVHRTLLDFTRRNEAAYRLFLAKGYEQQVKSGGETVKSVRGGTRLGMFEKALEPVSRSLGPRYRDLVHALSVASGPECHLVLKDLCGLSDEDVDRISERNLSAILRDYL
jgi:AcrR family transcriptional regulator